MTTHDTDAPADLPLLPVRMLNEFTYCPRLGYLEWVQGEFADSADTVEGRYRHRRVDQGAKRQTKKEPEGEEEKVVLHAQSVSFSSERLGLTAKIDLVEGEGSRVTPVDYKKSKRPHVAKGAWEPELVQLCAQGLLLREQGYECTEGVIYFVGSRERVTIPFDEELIALTRERIAQMRQAVVSGEIPPPLEESPKCVRCSLVGICLPDEVRFLTMNGNGLPEPRPLFPASDDTLPLHIQHPGAKVSKRGEVLAILDGDEILTEARLGEISPSLALRRNSHQHAGDSGALPPRYSDHLSLFGRMVLWDHPRDEPQEHRPEAAPVPGGRRSGPVPVTGAPVRCGEDRQLPNAVAPEPRASDRTGVTTDEMGHRTGRKSRKPRPAVGGGGAGRPPLL